MTHYQLETLLATGASNEDLISALIGGPAQLHLALNKNLTSAHVDRLLKKSDGYTEALIASRLDLTEAQMLKIIGSKRVLSRVALVNRPNRPGTQMSTELVEYVLSQRWFTPDYAVCFQNGPQSFTKEQRAALSSIISATSANYFIFTTPYKGLLTQLDNLKRGYQYEPNYLTGSKPPLEADRKLTTLSNLTINEFLTDLNSLRSFTVSEADMAAAIERRLTPIQSSTPQLLLSMLPGWHGTVAELLNTVRSLATSHLA